MLTAPLLHALLALLSALLTGLVMVSPPLWPVAAPAVTLGTGAQTLAHAYLSSTGALAMFLASHHCPSSALQQHIWMLDQ